MLSLFFIPSLFITILRLRVSAFTLPTTNPSILNNSISNAPLIFPSNLTSFLNNSLSPVSDPFARPAINCDGATYQRNLDRASCVDAFNQIDVDGDPLSIGQRAPPGSPPTDYDVDLPYRWISCRSTAGIQVLLFQWEQLARLLIQAGKSKREVHFRNSPKHNHARESCEFK